MTKMVTLQSGVTVYDKYITIFNFRAKQESQNPVIPSKIVCSGPRARGAPLLKKYGNPSIREMLVFQE